MDRLDAMRVLLAVVEAGSLSAGARALRAPLATVSRKVADLEAHLQTRLLTRTTRRLSLTDAGRAYVAAARRILEDVTEAERAAAGEYAAPRGELAVTAPMAFGRLHVLPVAQDFLRAYPDIDLRLELTDRIVDLQEERIDVALRIAPLPDSRLVAVRLGQIVPVVCAAPAYLKQRGLPRTPQDLQRHPMVCFQGFMTPGRWRFAAARGGRPVEVPARTRLLVTSAEAAVDAASAGLGVVSVFCYHAEAAFRAGALRRILPAHEGAPRPVQLVHGGQRAGAPQQVPLKLRAFLDHAVPRLKRRLDSVVEALELGLRAG